MSRLGDAAKAKELEADRDEMDYRREGYPDQLHALAALLRAIDDQDRSDDIRGVYEWAQDVTRAALALADTLLPTEGTKP